MLTDSDGGETRPRCHHRWVFVCWYRDPISRDGGTHDLRHMVEGCPRCGAARISLWVDDWRYPRNTYADSVEHAVLGKPYSLELAGVTAKVAAN